MTLFIVDGSPLQVVREPQYPELITLLTDNEDLLKRAHPGGSGAVTKSFILEFPWAIHAERWALPREFWSLRMQDIPRLDKPVTPSPVCWRYEGISMREHPDEGIAAGEEVSGFIELDWLDAAREYLEHELEDLGFYPWFEQVYIPACEHADKAEAEA